MSEFETASIIIGAFTALGTVGAVVFTLLKSFSNKRQHIYIKKTNDYGNFDSFTSIEIINADTKDIVIREIGIILNKEFRNISSFKCRDRLLSFPMILPPNESFKLLELEKTLCPIVFNKYEFRLKYGLVSKKEMREYAEYSIIIYYGVNQKKSVPTGITRRKLLNYYSLQNKRK